jgi:hypothetical protein
MIWPNREGTDPSVPNAYAPDRRRGEVGLGEVGEGGGCTSQAPGSECAEVAERVFWEPEILRGGPIGALRVGTTCWLLMEAADQGRAAIVSLRLEADTAAVKAAGRRQLSTLAGGRTCRCAGW